MFEITNDVFTVEELKRRLELVGLPFDEMESGADGVICLAFETDDDEYPIDTIVQGLQTALNERGYAIQFFLQSDQYKKHEGLTDD